MLVTSFVPFIYSIGHPDNVAPAIYGGIQIGMHTGERWTSERVNTPQGIQLVLFIPDFIGKTSDARAVLEVCRDDAYVHSSSMMMRRPNQCTLSYLTLSHSPK